MVRLTPDRAGEFYSVHASRPFFKDLVTTIESLSVLDMAELVKILEKKFGVSAAAPMMMAGMPAAGAAAEAVEEKTAFDVELAASGANKIAVIKVVNFFHSYLDPIIINCKNIFPA